MSLAQNYPNPVRTSGTGASDGTTRIPFSTIAEQHVRITGYDITGEEVATLVDDDLSAGQYEVTWSPSVLASGVYFYRIVTPSFVTTRKLICLH